MFDKIKIGTSGPKTVILKTSPAMASLILSFALTHCQTSLESYLLVEGEESLKRWKRTIKRFNTATKRIQDALYALNNRSGAEELSRDTPEEPQEPPTATLAPDSTSDTSWDIKEGLGPLRVGMCVRLKADPDISGRIIRGARGVFTVQRLTFRHTMSPFEFKAGESALEGITESYATKLETDARKRHDFSQPWMYTPDLTNDRW